MKHLPNNILAVNQSYYRDWARRYQDAHADGLRAVAPKLSNKYDIEIKGLLMATVPDYLRGWGLEATGYDEIAAVARELVQSPKEEIYIGVDSGGGYIYGIDRAIEALHELRAAKKIIVEVHQIAASAAYWLTCISHEIRVNRFSDVGSIGTYLMIDDTSEMYKDFGVRRILVSSGPHKGVGEDGVPVSDASVEIEQERINALAEMFLSDVRIYRPQVGDDVMSGRTWTGAASIGAGLADAQYGITRKANVMKDEEKNAAVEEEQAAPEEEENAAEPEEEPTEEDAPSPTEDEQEAEEEEEDEMAKERARCASIAATFAASPEFTAQHIRAGSSLVEAKAAWFDYSQGKQPAAAKPSRVVAANQPPLPVASNWADAIRQYAAANKCSLAEAGQKMATQRPDLYRQNFGGK